MTCVMKGGISAARDSTSTKVVVADRAVSTCVNIFRMAGSRPM